MSVMPAWRTWPGLDQVLTVGDMEKPDVAEVAADTVRTGLQETPPLPVVEVRPKTGSYDYRNKYTAGCTEYFCPADFDAATTKRIQDAALGAFKAIGGRDYARVDVMVRADGSPVVLEVNTLPGMTETSLLPKAARAGRFNHQPFAIQADRAGVRFKRPPLAVHAANAQRNRQHDAVGMPALGLHRGE